MVVCKYHLEGRCAKGDSCTYEHSFHAISTTAKRTLGTGNGITWKADSQFAQERKTSQTPCRYFQTGTCRSGSSCNFDHVLSPPAEVVPQQLEVASPRASQDTRVQVICKFFARGECRNGNSCPWSHSQNKEISENKQDWDGFNVSSLNPVLYARSKNCF